ncbi:MAG: hypothetical protein ACO3QC_06815, partial [Phycisphaerales bacterium]
MESFNASRLFAAGVIAAVIAGSAAAAGVDFEATAGRTPTETPLGDDSAISIDRAYLVGNTTVMFGWETSGDLLCDASMRLEDYNDGLVETEGVGGYREFGFADANGLGWDRDLDVQGDNWYLRVSREDGHRINTGSMLMTFGAGVAAVSGTLLDLDWNEKFRITAYDSMGNQISQIDTASGLGDERDGSLNSRAYNFSISGGGMEISF